MTAAIIETKTTEEGKGNMNKIFAYKIRHKLTGLYRNAGGVWSKTGKTWSNLGHLKNRLNSHRSRNGALEPDAVNWEVVTLEMIQSETSVVPVMELTRCAAVDGPLNFYTTRCPIDAEDLHFEQIGGMRVTRSVEGRRVYSARCPKCGREFTVKAPINAYED